MVYSHQFVAAVKVNGQVLRESKGEVAVPFGSEYSVYLKNMASVRALARVEIDGQDATGGLWLVLEPNGGMDLERFIRNGNRESGNRFKFVKRTGKVEEVRGIRAEDGLVRVEYKFEKLPDPEVHTHHYHHHHHNYDHWHWGWLYRWPSYPYWDYPWTVTCNTTTSGAQGVSGSYNMGAAAGDVNLCNAGLDSASYSFTSSSASPLRSRGLNLQKSAAAMPEYREASCLMAQQMASEDPGITVEGSVSNQRFQDSAWFQTEDASHTLVLRLVGAVGGRAVTRAVTVKTKARCKTCGTLNKSGVKFCKECGTSLGVV